MTLSESDLLPGTPVWAFDLANRAVAHEFGIAAPPEAWGKSTIERVSEGIVAWRVTLTERILGTYIVEVSGLGEILYCAEHE